MYFVRPSSLCGVVPPVVWWVPRNTGIRCNSTSTTSHCRTNYHRNSILQCLSVVHCTCRKEDIRNYLRESDEPDQDGILDSGESAKGFDKAKEEVTSESGAAESNTTSTEEESSKDDVTAASESGSNGGSNQSKAKDSEISVPAFIENVSTLSQKMKKIVKNEADPLVDWNRQPIPAIPQSFMGLGPPKMDDIVRIERLDKIESLQCGLNCCTSSYIKSVRFYDGAKALAIGSLGSPASVAVRHEWDSRKEMSGLGSAHLAVTAEQGLLQGRMKWAIDLTKAELLPPKQSEADWRPDALIGVSCAPLRTGSAFSSPGSVAIDVQTGDVYVDGKRTTASGTDGGSGDPMGGRAASAREQEWAVFRAQLRPKTNSRGLQYEFMLVVQPPPDMIGKPGARATGTLYARTIPLKKQNRWLMLHDGMPCGAQYHPTVFFRDDGCAAILRDVDVAAPQLNQQEQRQQIGEADAVAKQSTIVLDRLQRLKNEAEEAKRDTRHTKTEAIYSLVRFKEYMEGISARIPGMLAERLEKPGAKFTGRSKAIEVRSDLQKDAAKNLDLDEKGTDEAMGKSSPLTTSGTRRHTQATAAASATGASAGGRGSVD